MLGQQCFYPRYHFLHIRNIRRQRRIALRRGESHPPQGLDSSLELLAGRAAAGEIGKDGLLECVGDATEQLPVIGIDHAGSQSRNCLMQGRARVIRSAMRTFRVRPSAKERAAVSEMTACLISPNRR